MISYKERLNHITTFLFDVDGVLTNGDVLLFQNEILRTLKSGGQFIILETSVPTKFPFKQGYFLYTNFVMPTIGKLFSKDKKAYAYLSSSAQNFPFGEVLNNILRKIGFIEVVHLPQTMGVATIYTASKK